MADNAPGRHHRQGVTTRELVAMFPDAPTAERWFEDVAWGETGRYCPRCGSLDTKERPSRKPMPYWCRACRFYFSVRTGTPMERSKIALHDWAIAIYLQATSLKGVSSMRLHRELGITQKSAWLVGRMRGVPGSAGVPPAHALRSALPAAFAYPERPKSRDRGRRAHATIVRSSRWTNTSP